MTSYKDDWARLSRSIESMLGQTFTNFEMIIIFEQGDENFSRVRESYDDNRIVLIENEGRLGRSISYNRGLGLAQGRYLARMDGDDYSSPDRIERQVAYLLANPDISLVGTAATLCDDSDSEVGTRIFPETHEKIVKAMAFTTPICHPTVLWDMDKVGRDLRFDLRFARFCDDLELWMRLVRKGHRLANLPDTLIIYRQPGRYTRPVENWRFSLRVRILHFGIAARHPRYLLGLIGIAILATLPQWILDNIVGRNWLSDRIRLIRS